MDCATQCEYQYMVTWLQLRLTRNKHTATVTYHAGKSDIPRQLQFVDRSADYLRALVHFQLCDLRICQREAFGCVSICIKQYLKYFARSYEFLIDNRDINCMSSTSAIVFSTPNSFADRQVRILASELSVRATKASKSCMP